MIPKRMKTIIPVLGLFVLYLTGCTSANQLATTASSAMNQQATATPLPMTPASNPVTTAALQGTLENIYAQVNPSVVHIEVEQHPFPNTANLPQFPSLPGFPQLPQPNPNSVVRGEGSGFVWDTEGHIVTNNHVIAGADNITVVFADDTMAKATLVGTDPDSDLAVLQIEVPAAELQPVQLADSTQLQVGDLAIAIGNPFGQEGSITVGIISALGRLLPVEESSTGPQYNIPDIIQTDAAINPGNSGGVLLNDQGQVVGVTSAIISPIRASSGVGFAIPSAIVQQVVPALIETGRYEHPYLGISGVTLTPDLAAAMNLPDNQRGALVVEVLPGGPADKAKLRGSDRQVEIDGEPMVVGGDVITAIAGQPVRNIDDLITYLGRYGKVGDSLELTILRDGREQTVQVTLLARPVNENQEVDGNGAAESGDHQAWLGIASTDVTAEIAQSMNLPQDQSGVLVEQVEQGSPADTAGLRGSYKPATINGERILLGGDVIIAANGRDVTAVQGLQAILAQAKPGDRLSFTILRDGREMQLDITLGER